MNGSKQAKPLFASACFRRSPWQSLKQLTSFFSNSYIYLNPFLWPKRLVKTLTTAFFMIMLPVYLFIGLQPAPYADAANHPILEIPAINLQTPVASVELIDRQLAVPATIAGIYQPSDNKLFIIGHSSTVFQNLDQLQNDDVLIYNGESYKIRNRTILAKDAISMNKILADTPQKTIIIMTCAGDPLPNQDATHRLIITATLN